MIFVIHICISVLIIYITAMSQAISARGSTSTAPPPTGSCTSSHIWHSNSEPSHKKQSLLPAGPELQSCWLQGLTMPVSKCPEERFSKKAVYCHSWGYQPYLFCPDFDHRHCPWYLTGDSIICIKYMSEEAFLVYSSYIQKMIALANPKRPNGIHDHPGTPKNK